MVVYLRRYLQASEVKFNSTEGINIGFILENQLNKTLAFFIRSCIEPCLLNMKILITERSFTKLFFFFIFQDEFHSRLRFNRRGLVAMANAGPHDNGSQFFFTLGRADELNNKHTIFGKVCVSYLQFL